MLGESSCEELCPHVPSDLHSRSRPRRLAPAHSQSTLETGRSFLSTCPLLSHFLMGMVMAHTGRSLAAPPSAPGQVVPAPPSWSLGLDCWPPILRGPREPVGQSQAQEPSLAAGDCSVGRTGSEMGPRYGPGLDTGRGWGHLSALLSCNPSGLSLLCSASPLGHLGTSSPLAAWWVLWHQALVVPEWGRGPPPHSRGSPRDHRPGE